MVGRPKNPNRPPTVTAVRITERTKSKLERLHNLWNSQEPYDRTLERALDELESLRKKVKALELELEGQKTDGYYINANEELIKILKKRDAEIAQLKNQRKAMTIQNEDQ